MLCIRADKIAPVQRGFIAIPHRLMGTLKDNRTPSGRSFIHCEPPGLSTAETKYFYSLQEFQPDHFVQKC